MLQWKLSIMFSVRNIQVMLVALLCDIQCHIKVIQNQTSRPGILSHELNLLLNISYTVITHISHRWPQWNDVMLSKKWCVDHLQEPINQTTNWKISKMSNYHQDSIFTHPSYANSWNPDGSPGQNYHQSVKILSILHNEIKQPKKKKKAILTALISCSMNNPHLKLWQWGKKSLWCGHLHLNCSTLCLNSEWQPGGFRRGYRGISEVLSIITTEPPPKLQPSQLPFLFSHSFFPPTVKGMPSRPWQATLKCTFYSNVNDESFFFPTTFEKHCWMNLIKSVWLR